MKRLAYWFAILLVTLSLSSCGYNRFQNLDETTKSAWAEVLNQYQRRADLIPNLVNTVKGYAQHEKETLEAVVNARARATSVQLTPEMLDNPEMMAKFQKAQGELSSVLSRLLAITENYPDLKANENFRDLQAQLEGTENRIAVARQRYIKAVQDYNILTREFPTNVTAMIFGYKVKQSFTVEDEQAIARPPKVDFGTSKPAAPKVDFGAQQKFGGQKQ